MSNDRDLLNMDDPYDAHAYFICEFSCDDCGAELARDEGCDGCDDQDCRDLSDKAKAHGWYVPPPNAPDGRMDLQTCYCSACAAKRGLRAPK